MPPDPPSVLVPLALDSIFAGLTLNCFRLACYYQWVILSIILRILNNINPGISTALRISAAPPISAAPRPTNLISATLE